METKIDFGSREALSILQNSGFFFVPSTPVFSAKVCRRAVEVEITSRCERRRGEYAPPFTVRVSADQLNVEQHAWGAANSTEVSFQRQTKTCFYHQRFRSKAFCGRKVKDCQGITEISVKERHQLTHSMLLALIPTVAFRDANTSERRKSCLFFRRLG